MRHDHSFITMENLEFRQLLAASVSDGALIVTGTNSSDRIELQLRTQENIIRVRVTLNQEQTEFPIAGITNIRVNGARGNDLIEYSGRDGGVPIPGLLNGGRGNDTIIGSAVSDVIFGGNGHDRIEGKAGNDILAGGNGNDVIQGGNGNDTLHGDAGNDDVFGNQHNDIMTGDAGDDDLFGGRGTDTILGSGGNDDFGSDRVLEIRDRNKGDRGNNTNL